MPPTDKTEVLRVIGSTTRADRNPVVEGPLAIASLGKLADAAVSSPHLVSNLPPAAMTERLSVGACHRVSSNPLALFAPDADIVMVTSEDSLLRGPDEVGAFLHRYGQGTTRYSWTWDRCDVSAAGAVGWLLAEGTEISAAEDREEKHPYRMSVVCERRNGRWFLVQIHGSSPHLG